MKNAILKRIRNKAFWVAVAALVALIGKQTGLYSLPDDFDSVVETVLYLLVAMGILIDPASKGKFDTK